MIFKFHTKTPFMKKALYLSSSIIIAMTSCTKMQRDVPVSPPPAATEARAGAAANIQSGDQSSVVNDGKCQLTRIAWNDGSFYQFGYNNQGRATSWMIDYGDGWYNSHVLSYDNQGRMKSSHL